MSSDIKVEYIHHCGSDLTVVNAARVSFHKESTELLEKDVRLINYLAKHGHISPFHHAFITLRVTAPIFVARQLVKHKFMPWNEVSRRYVDEQPEIYLPDFWRERSENVKQGSKTTECKEVTETGLDEYVKWTLNKIIHYYNDLLDAGVAPEQARMILPQNTMTEWYWSGSLSAWASMLNLRLKPEAQAETRLVAQKVYEIILPLFPVSLNALLDNGIVH